MSRLVVIAGSTSYAQSSSTITFLSDVTPTSATIGWGTIGKDVSVMRTTLKINGAVYPKGIGTHASSDIRYNLAGRCSRFQAVVGVDDYVTRGTIRFQVLADGAMLYDSGLRTGADAGAAVSVDVSGRSALRLVVTDSGDGIGSDHADWADAKVVCSTPIAAPAPVVSYVSDVTPVSSTIGWGTIAKDLAVMRTPLRMNGVTFAKGIGTHAASDIRYALNGRCSRFEAVVGVDDYVNRGSIRFQVWADGAMLYDSGIVTSIYAGVPVSVDVAGRNQLRLVAADGGDGIGSDHADWADAKVTCNTSLVPATASFAYWNVAAGNGLPRLAAPNFANPDKPFACTAKSGAPVDDSSYGTPAGAAILQPNGAMTEALIQHIGTDPTVVALGVGEAWGGAQVKRIAEVLGWPLTNATTEDVGNAILTRYGFTRQGVGPPIGQMGTEIFRPIFADVCLDKNCARTMPFVAVHTQSPDEVYDAGIATLLTYIDTMVPIGRSVVMQGDFNTWDRLTDPQVCVGASQPGVGHEAGLRRLLGAGFTSLFRLKNPSANAYTGMLNNPTYSQSTTSCLANAGLPQGHPYKAIDYTFARNIADADVLAAGKFGVPIGGYGNCAGSDHLGVKATVRVP